MAIGWLAVLKMVPWGDVISNAPKVADGAKKLWSAVSKKPPAADLSTAGTQTVAPQAQSIAMLQAQLAAAKAEVSDLHDQMLASSELIKALADQSTQLVKRVEVNRMRVLWLAGAVGILCVVVAIILALLLAR